MQLNKLRGASPSVFEGKNTINHDGYLHGPLICASQSILITINYTSQYTSEAGEN